MVTDMTSVDAMVGQITCLYDRHHAEIFGYLCKLLNDRQAAEDLVQETFLNAYRARAGLARIQNPRAWLYRIATNLALTAIKRRNRWSWLPWSDSTGYASTQSDMGDRLGTRTAVQSALAQLPLSYQAPLILSVHFGLTIPELAQAFETTPEAIRIRLCRAREMFRQAYIKGETE